MDEVRDIDVKDQIDALLERVEKGEQITITRAGKPVARLVHVPAPASREEAAKAAAARILERSRQMSLGGLGIKDLIEEGRA
jgi:antitoxin (DNA-binding transcriptional repressor) of toxin-antitoxin stability system